MPRKSVLALAVCAALGGAAPVWADCTAVPSGSTTDPATGILEPASSDTVTCSGTSAVSVSKAAATAVYPSSVTVNISGSLTPPTFTNTTVFSRPAVSLGEGVNVTNDGTITIGNPIDGKEGAITLRGAGNNVVNNGTISVIGGAAIQGLLDINQPATGVVGNTGTIYVDSDTNPAIVLGDGAQITNSGRIELLYKLSSTPNRTLEVGANSRVENQATGVIRASEAPGSAAAANLALTAVSLNAGSTLVNAGLIDVIGDASGRSRGTAVGRAGAETIPGSRMTIENTGVIDASRAAYAVNMGEPATIINSGTIRGGAGAAIALTNSEGSELVLRGASQIVGSVSVRRLDIVPLSDADLGNDPSAIEFCRQNPTDIFCTKTVTSLPNQATLALEGTVGAEDDRLSGFNRIEKRGAGTWTLNTALQAGSASDAYQSGDFRGPLNIDVQDAAGRLNLAGAITDGNDGTRGELVKDGAGLLALSGNNTYSGPTRVNAGILQANGGNAIGDNSAVTLGAGTALDLRAPEVIGSLAGAGDVLLENNALTTGGDNTSTTFNGSIVTGGGLIKIGTGTLRLSGNSPSTGLLAVSDGVLDMAGTTAMRVGTTPAGTLIGAGTVGRLFNQGRVAPGNSVGTLTVAADYVQTATGTLDIEIRPDGSANDLLAVGGSATLAGTMKAQGENGALLTPAAGGTAANPKLYTILTAGGVSGQFGTTPAPLGAFTFDTIYNPTNVQLGVTYAGFTAIQQPGVIPGTGTSNQVSKAAGLDRVPIDPGAGIYTSGNADFDRVLLEIANETADQLADTFNAIIAEPYAAFNTVLLEQNDFYAETVLDRAQVCSVRGRSSLGGDFLPERRTSDGTAAAGCGTAAGQRPHGAWLDATWVQGDVDGEDGLSGYNYRLAGAVLGGDTALSDDVAVGVAVGFGQPKLDSYDLADAEIDGDSWFVSGYGTVTRDRWEFAGLLGYTWGSYDSTRRIRFGSIDRTTQGDFDGDGFIASAKAAYFHQVDGIDVVPEFGLTYSKIWQDGFTETGADSLNLKVEDADAHSLVTSIGVRIGTELQRGETRIRPQALLRYEYDWNADDDDAHEVTSSFAAVPVVGSIDIIGQNRGEHGLTAGAGATVQVADNVDLFAGAGYRWNSNGDEYSFGAGARMAW